VDVKLKIITHRQRQTANVMQHRSNPAAGGNKNTAYFDKKDSDKKKKNND